MRKLYSLLLVVMALMIPKGAWAALSVGDRFTVDGMNFQVTSVNPNEVQVGYNAQPAIDKNTQGTVSIPSSVTGTDGNNYSVTSIGSQAFAKCEKVTEIIIPESIKTIGNSAFSSCFMLTGITIPESVTTIGDYAFYGCTKLTGINIPKNVTTIGKYAFYHCDSFTSITIPSTVSTWGEWVFGHCDLLSTVIISDGVTSIGESLFDNCVNLTSVTIPSTVATIGKCAFAYCSSLTNIALPKGVKTINEEAFGCCSSLTNVVLPEGLTTIADGVFFRCSSLTSINIPSSVTYIGGAFSQCPALTEVHITDLKAWCGIEFKNNSTANPLIIAQHLYLNGKEVKDLVIPEGTTKIGEFAFYKCNSLTSVTIPSGVTDFGERVFDSCEGLTSVTSASNLPSQTFRLCKNLKDVTLLDGVTNIGERAFRQSGLTTITIPSSLKSVESYAFSECTALTEVHIKDVASWCAIDFGYDNNPLYYAHHLFLNGNEVKELVIPEGVSAINYRAFVGCEGLTSVKIPTTVTSIGESAFYNCVSLKEVICNIEEPFAINENAFMNKVDGTEVFTSAILTVPQGTKELYQNTDGWKRFAYISDGTSIAPVDEGDNTDYGNGDINENTDLNGNVVGNIYYNISDDNGEYSSTEGCIILRKSTSDTDMNNLEGQDIFGEDFKNGFTGIVFMVQAGSGTVKVNAETVGNMTLKVKFGNNAPVTMELEGKMKASFPYSVLEPTYVYIYGGETQTANAKGLRAASSNNALKIYGIEWSDEYEASNIESVLDNINSNAIIYNLQGQRLRNATKGINIINGKKVIVK